MSPPSSGFVSLHLALPGPLLDVNPVAVLEMVLLRNQLLVLHDFGVERANVLAWGA